MHKCILRIRLIEYHFRIGAERYWIIISLVARIQWISLPHQSFTSRHTFTQVLLSTSVVGSLTSIVICIAILTVGTFVQRDVSFHSQCHVSTEALLVGSRNCSRSIVQIFKDIVHYNIAIRTWSVNHIFFCRVYNRSYPLYVTIHANQLIIFPCPVQTCQTFIISFNSVIKRRCFQSFDNIISTTDFGERVGPICRSSYYTCISPDCRLIVYLIITQCLKIVPSATTAVSITWIVVIERIALVVKITRITPICRSIGKGIQRCFVEKVITTCQGHQCHCSVYE